MMLLAEMELWEVRRFVVVEVVEEQRLMVEVAVLEQHLEAEESPQPARAKDLDARRVSSGL